MRQLYLECSSGISGDMTVAALLDLGADKSVLEAALGSLHMDGYRVEIGRAVKCGLSAARFHVHLEDAGHSHTHAHEHRTLRDIFPILDRAQLSEAARTMSRRIFTCLAQAEGRVHGKSPEEVHFHEVGAVDSIVDIVGATVCLDNLGFDGLSCSPLTEGRGQVHCQHGLMPVPVPATLELVRAAGIALSLTDIEGEMVTPTGAAIVAALWTGKGRPETARVLKIGMGAGAKEFPHPNVLRAFIVETEETEEYADRVVELETALDDDTPERLSFAMEVLFAAGALEVYFTPVTMKKSRPGTVLTVLCSPGQETQMTGLIFRETSAIGLRRRESERTKMRREPLEVDLPEGKVNLKRSSYHDIEKYSVEYESAKELALRCGLPIREVYRSALNAVSYHGRRP